MKRDPFKHTYVTDAGVADWRHDMENRAYRRDRRWIGSLKTWGSCPWSDSQLRPHRRPTALTLSFFPFMKGIGMTRLNRALLPRSRETPGSRRSQYRSRDRSSRIYAHLRTVSVSHGAQALHQPHCSGTLTASPTPTEAQTTLV